MPPEICSEKWIQRSINSKRQSPINIRKHRTYIENLFDHMAGYRQCLRVNGAQPYNNSGHVASFSQHQQIRTSSSAPLMNVHCVETQQH